MEIRLNRSPFLGELAPMQGIVERRTTIPALSHLLLTAQGDRLKIAGTDLDVSLTSSVEAEIVREGAIAVQAKKFVEIIRALVGEKVRLGLEGQSLTIAAAGSRFKIRGLPAQDFPTLPDVTTGDAVAVPYALFRRMAARVIFAVSSEESRFQLNGALFKLKKGALEMVATDGHRLALVENEVASVAAEDSVLVPRKALQELLRFEGTGDLTFRRGEHHLSFRSGHRELICRILEGTFPDYERVIAKDNESRATFDRQALAEAIRRVALLTGDRARSVRLSLRSEILTISAANPDLGEAVEEVPCVYQGPEIQLGVNPDYLDQFLSAFSSPSVRLELKDENSQCLGIPVDGEDKRYLCVIMPMRI